MSLCPCCGRGLCDHSPEERHQTVEEMMNPLTEKEIKAFDTGDDILKKAVAIETHIDYQIQLREAQSHSKGKESGS